MSTTNTEPHAGGRPWLWPAIIIGGLSIHVMGLIIVVLVATRDPSFAVEPNSYQKALGWDALMARQRASQQLGWAASLEVTPQADLTGRRRIICRIVDKDGVAVVGANVQLLMFHHARAADRVQVNLSPEKDGTYSGLVQMKRDGLWECRIAAKRGDALFRTVIMQEVKIH